MSTCLSFLRKALSGFKRNQQERARRQWQDHYARSKGYKNWRDYVTFLNDNINGEALKDVQGSKAFLKERLREIEHV